MMQVDGDDGGKGKKCYIKKALSHHATECLTKRVLVILSVFHIVECHVCGNQKDENAEIEQCRNKNGDDEICRMKCRQFIVFMRECSECRLHMCLYVYYKIYLILNQVYLILCLDG